MSGNNGEKFELKIIIANLGPKFKSGTFLFPCVKKTLNPRRTTVSDRPTLNLLGDIRMPMEYSCNDADAGNPKNSDKNLSLCHSPGSEPGLRAEKPTTDTLNIARLELQEDPEYEGVILDISQDFLQYELVEIGR
jgi:hypothetical protein